MAPELNPQIVDQEFVESHLKRRSLATVLVPKANGGMCIALRTDRYWQISSAPGGTSLCATDLLTIPVEHRPLISQSRPLGELPVGRPLNDVTLEDNGRSLHLTMADGSVLHLVAEGENVHAAVDGPDGLLTPRFSSVVQVRAAASEALGRSLGRLLGQAGFTSTADRMTWTRQVEDGVHRIRFVLEPFPSMSRQHDGRVRTMVEVAYEGLAQFDGSPVPITWSAATNRVVPQPTTDSFTGPEQLEEMATSLRQDMQSLLRTIGDAGSANALAARVAEGDSRFPIDTALAVAVAKWLAERDDARAAAFLDTALSGAPRRRHTQLLAELRGLFPDAGPKEAGQSGQETPEPEGVSGSTHAMPPSDSAALELEGLVESIEPLGPSAPAGNLADHTTMAYPHPGAGSASEEHGEQERVADVLDGRGSGLHWVTVDPDDVRSALAERRPDLTVVSAGAESATQAKLAEALVCRTHGAKPAIAVRLERALSLLPPKSAVVLDLDTVMTEVPAEEWEQTVDALEAAAGVQATIERQLLVLLCGPEETVRLRMARWWRDGNRVRHTAGWTVWLAGPGRVAIDDGDGWSTTVACSPTDDTLVLHPDRLDSEDFEPEEDGVSLYERLVEGVRRLRPYMKVERAPGPSTLATLTVAGVLRKPRHGVLWVAGSGSALAEALFADDSERPIMVLDGKRCRTGRRFFNHLLEVTGLPDKVRPDWDALATLPQHLIDGTFVIIDNAATALIDAPQPSWELMLGLCDTIVAEKDRNLTVALCDANANALNKRRWVWHPHHDADSPSAHHPTGPTLMRAGDGTWYYREAGRTMTFRVVYHQARLWIDGSTFHAVAPNGAPPLSAAATSEAMAHAAAAVSILHDGRAVLPIPAPRSGARARPLLH